MREPFNQLLSIGGKSNSLGKAGEVVEAVLQDKSRLDELYNCLFSEDAWTRMRAADSLEKVCRVHPEWLEPYIDRFAAELLTSPQASIQWHLAQIFQQVHLTSAQKAIVVQWLKKLLYSTDVDWIVATNAMDALVRFTHEGAVSAAETRVILTTQQQHHSTAVVKRANKLLPEL